VGQLFGKSWGKVASVLNGSLGFKVIGLFPQPKCNFGPLFSIASNSVTPSNIKQVQRSTTICLISQ
jgi:hypothetical protein